MGATWSPTAIVVVWTMMDVPLFSGFAVRFVMMLVITILYSLLVTRYALRIQKDPTRSLTGNTDWLTPGGDEGDLAEVTLRKKDLLIAALFFGQYLVIVLCMSVLACPMASSRPS